MGVADPGHLLQALARLPALPPCVDAALRLRLLDGRPVMAAEVATYAVAGLMRQAAADKRSRRFSCLQYAVAAALVEGDRLRAALMPLAVMTDVL